MTKKTTIYNIQEDSYKESEAYKAAMVFAPVAVGECYIQKETVHGIGIGIGLYAQKMETSTSNWRDVLPTGTIGEAALTASKAADYAADWHGNWEVQSFPVTGRYWTHGSMSAPKNGRIVLSF